MELELIYNALQAGKKFGKNELHCRFPVFHVVLCKTTSGNIYYNHFGSSCVENSVEGLRFVITSIFKLTPKEFFDRYAMM